jgi:hypothetical protein
MPAVSVIIATFNRSRMLRCAIRSVLGQQFTDFEVLVSGDACTDDSEAVVAAFNDERVQWMNRAVNWGNQSGPNNDAIARARSGYIAFLGHDDLWLPWHLETLVPLLDAGADLAHPIGAFIGPEGVRDVFAAPPAGETYRTNLVPPSGWLVRKSVLEAMGGFRDHSITGRGTDWDLLWRIARAGYRIEAVPRLSVLKLPSQWWRSYGADAAVPQELWLSRDPTEVERGLLTASVNTLFSSRPYATPTRAFALGYRNVLHWLRNRTEGERGLVAKLFGWRFRKKFRALRKSRGLP